LPKKCPHIFPRGHSPFSTATRRYFTVICKLFL